MKGTTKRIILLAAVLGIAAMAFWPKEEATAETITRTVEAGDTVYGIAAQVATPKDNINYLSWLICRDNGIKNPGDLQPGTVLVIRK